MSFAGFLDKDREGLDTTKANQKGFDCGPPSYCGNQMGTPNVPGSSTPIFHRTKTTITDGKAKTDVYILSDGNWVNAATTSDGGKTFTFNEAKRPDGTPIVGAGVRQSLSSGEGAMNKNVKAQISRTLKDGGADLTSQPKLTDQQIKQTGAVDSNTSTTEESIGAESFNQQQTINEIGKANFRRDYGDNNRYPLKMKPDQDHIKFTMYAYAPKSFSVADALGGFSGGERGNKGERLGSVVLPIQPQISDSNSVVWGEDQISAVDAVVAAAALASIKVGVSGAQESGEQIVKGVSEQKENITTSIAAKFAQNAASINGNFLSRVTGGILNNNLELLFQGPALRTFTFTFLMSAREEDETEMIRKIIRFFKQGMSVKRTDGNLFLKAPNVFDIEYLHRNAPHKYINKIKTCALQNCSVNYTPDGNYSTYTDGSMTQYSLTLTFGEIDPIYDDEYTEPDNIGF